MRKRLETLFVFVWVVAPCLFGVFCAGAVLGALVGVQPFFLGLLSMLTWTLCSLLLSMHGWSPSKTEGDGHG